MDEIPTVRRDADRTMLLKPRSAVSRRAFERAGDPMEPVIA